MPNPIIEDNNFPLFEKVVEHSKQASVVSTDNEQGLIANAILDFNGSISLSPAQQLKEKDALYQGTLRESKPNQEAVLALLLDPNDVTALIESNISQDASISEDSLILPANRENTILKIEDVLHQEDDLRKYLPEDEDKWYLIGDGRAIDKAIASPVIRDIHNELLMQQLLMQNPTE